MDENPQNQQPDPNSEHDKMPFSPWPGSWQIPLTFKSHAKKWGMFWLGCAVLLYIAYAFPTGHWPFRRGYAPPVHMQEEVESFLERYARWGARAMLFALGLGFVGYFILQFAQELRKNAKNVSPEE